MKKSTGILLLLTFFVVVVVMIGLVVTLMVYVMQGNTPNLLGSKRLALIRVEGIIYDAKEWVDQVKEYQDDSTVKGIVLRVESPGGAVDPSQELYDALVEAQEVYGKVVVASFGSVAASGGYYVACNADKIVSSPGSLTGSIGVYSKFPVAKELMEKIGISYETVKAGEYKDFGSMDRGLTDKERAMMQSVIDDTYDQFVEAVYKGRKKKLSTLLKKWKDESPVKYPFTPDMTSLIQQYQAEHRDELASKNPSSASAETVSSATFAWSERISSGSPVVGNATLSEASFEETANDVTIREASNTIRESIDAVEIPDDPILLAYTRAIAEGKIYTGRQALKVGLVDKLGTLDDAIQYAAEMVGIRGEPTVIERKKREYGILDFLTESLSSLTRNEIHSPIMYRMPY